MFRFANTVEDGTSCGDSGLQLCLAGVCEVGLPFDLGLGLNLGLPLGLGLDVVF